MSRPSKARGAHCHQGRIEFQLAMECNMWPNTTLIWFCRAVQSLQSLAWWQHWSRAPQSWWPLGAKTRQYRTRWSAFCRRSHDYLELRFCRSIRFSAAKTSFENQGCSSLACIGCHGFQSGHKSSCRDDAFQFDDVRGRDRGAGPWGSAARMKAHMAQKKEHPTRYQAYMGDYSGHKTELIPVWAHFDSWKYLAEANWPARTQLSTFLLILCIFRCCCLATYLAISIL